MGMRYQPQGRAQASALARQLGVRSLIIPVGGALAELIKPASVSMSGLARAATPGGLAFTSGGSGAAAIVGAFQSQAFSRIAVVTPAAMVSAGTISDSRGGGVGGAQWRIDPPGELVLNKSNVANVGTSSGAGLAVGKTSVVGVTYDGSRVEFYVNGRAVGGATGAHTFEADGAGSLFSRGAGGEKINGAIAMHGEMPPQPRAVMLALTANPWQLFADPEEDDEPLLPAEVSRSTTVTPSSLLLGGGEVAMRASRRIGVQAAGMVASGGDGALRVSRKLGVQPAGLSVEGGAVALRASRTLGGSAANLALHSGEAQLRASRRLTVAPVEMTVAGGSIQFAYTPAPAAGNYVTAITPTALSLAGGSVSMRATRRLSVPTASLSLAGGDVRLLAARRIDVAPAVLGLAAGQTLLCATRRLLIEPSQLTVVGGVVTFRYSEQIEYARAPAGSGYSPQRVEVQARPAQLGGSRPALIQRNDR